MQEAKQLITTEKLQVVKQCHSKKSNWITGANFTEAETKLASPWSYLSATELFTAVCLVTWPLNESEAVSDLVMIETSLLLLGKFLLISMRTASLR